jgi:glycosyltransferase involved in cell wall biosynthesis
LRVLLLQRTFPPSRGAAGFVAEQFAHYLSAVGDDVTVCAAGNDADDHDAAFRILRVREARGGATGLGAKLADYAAFVSGAFWRTVALDPFDVVVTMSDPPLLGTLGMMLSAHWRAAHVLWLQDLHPDLAVALGILRRGGLAALTASALSDLSARQADAIVCVGRCMESRLRANGLDRVHCIPNGVTPPEIHFDPNGASTFRRRHGLVGRVVGMYSGNLGRAHAFEDLIQAALMLRLIAPEFLLLIVGDGPRRAELRSRLNMEASPNVVLLDPVDRSELPGMLSAADVHFVSLRDEAAGMVVPSRVYACLASARPVIFVGPEECEASRVVVETGAGVHVKTGDVLALVAAVRDVVDRALFWQLAAGRAALAARTCAAGRSFRRMKEVLHMVTSPARREWQRPSSKGSPDRESASNT